VTGSTLLVGADPSSAMNCKIEGNVAAQGGGLHIGSGGATLSGCTFSNNAAVHAGGMINGGSQTTVATDDGIEILLPESRRC